MKYILAISFSIIASTIAFGQANTIKFIDADDSISYKYYSSAITSLGLKPLFESTFTEHYRINSVNQYIEIWQDTIWKGKLTSYVYELVDVKKERSTERHYSISSILDSTQLTSILSLLRTKTFEQTPSKYTTDTINKYICLHSPINIVEVFNTAYYFRDYEFCSRNENALTISKLIDSILIITKADLQNKTLIENVPFEMFTVDGYRIARMVSTRRERREYRRERNRYRKSIGISNKPEREKN